MQALIIIIRYYHLHYDTVILLLLELIQSIIITLLFAISNRSAKEAEDNIRKALEKGQVLPKEERFDSNCITPGMHLCALIYYVQNMQYRDSAYGQNLVVVLLSRMAQCCPDTLRLISCPVYG